MKIYSVKLESPVGTLIACATDDAICLLEFDDKSPETKQKIFASISKSLKGEIIETSNKHLDKLKKQLEEYFEGKRKDFDLPIIFTGTDFQNRAWTQLQTIPYGETRSYKNQATAINSPKAVRAVGGANGKNKISIIVPCHRVIGHNGTLTGYGGELWRKKWLLEFEKKNCK